MAAEASRPVLCVVGAGKNSGEAIINDFSKQNFRVAVVSRSRPEGFGAHGVLSISVDLSNPTVIPSIFEKVRAQWGPPSVVIYTAAARRVVSPTDPLKDLSCTISGRPQH